MSVSARRRASVWLLFALHIIIVAWMKPAHAGVNGHRIKYNMDFADAYMHWALNKSLSTLTVSLWSKCGAAKRELKWCVRARGVPAVMIATCLLEAIRWNIFSH